MLKSRDPLIILLWNHLVLWQQHVIEQTDLDQFFWSVQFQLVWTNFVKLSHYRVLFWYFLWWDYFWSVADTKLSYRVQYLGGIFNLMKVFQQGQIRYFGNYWGQILIWQVFDKIMERQSTHGMKIMANSMHGQQHYKQFWKMPIFRIWAVAEKFLEGQGYYGLYRELHFHDQFLKSYLIWINGLNVKELLTLSDDGQPTQGYKMHIVTWVFVGYFGLLLDEWDQFDILILFWGNYWNNDDNSLAVLWRELHVWSLSCQILTATAVMRTLWIMTGGRRRRT